MILNALRTIERRTHSCLTFKMWSDESENISIDPARDARGCEASVGRNPGWKTRTRLGSECMKPGIILHELLHALGFFHEHARPDRDDYLDVFPDHIEPGKYDPNFIILTNMSNHGIQYDLESIIHYSPLAFAQNRNRPTMLPKVRMPVKMGHQEYLSSLDVSHVSKLKRAYGCIDEYLEHVPRPVQFTCTVDHYVNTAALSTTMLPTTSTGDTEGCCPKANLFYCGWILPESCGKWGQPDDLFWCESKGSQPLFREYCHRGCGDGGMGNSDSCNGDSSQPLYRAIVSNDIA